MIFKNEIEHGYDTRSPGVTVAEIMSNSFVRYGIKLYSNEEGMLEWYNENEEEAIDQVRDADYIVHIDDRTKYEEWRDIVMHEAKLRIMMAKVSAARLDIDKEDMNKGILAAEIISECRNHFVDDAAQYIEGPMQQLHNKELMLGLIAMTYVVFANDWTMENIPDTWGIPRNILSMAFNHKCSAHWKVCKMKVRWRQSPNGCGLKPSENNTVIYSHPNGAIALHNRMQNNHRRTIQIGDRLIIIIETRSTEQSERFLGTPELTLNVHLIKFYARRAVIDPRMKTANKLPWNARKTHTRERAGTNVKNFGKVDYFKLERGKPTEPWEFQTHDGKITQICE